MYIAKSVPFHEAQRGEFFYAVHEVRDSLRVDVCDVPPLEIAFAQMTRRSSSVLALRIFSHACKSLKVITMFRGETRQPVYFPAFFPRAIAYLNAMWRWRFFFSPFARWSDLDVRERIRAYVATVYVAAFIERNSSSSNSTFNRCLNTLNVTTVITVRYNRNGHDLFHLHMYKM